MPEPEEHPVLKSLREMQLDELSPMEALEKLDQLAFPSAEEHYKDLKWRFAIETDYLGEPSSVIFAAMSGDNGSVAYHWKLPFNTSNLNLNVTSIRNDDIVELPAPTVTAPMIKKLNTSNDA